jgi:hypothetical protein
VNARFIHKDVKKNLGEFSSKAKKNKLAKSKHGKKTVIIC